MSRRIVLCIFAILLLPFIRPSAALAPQIVDDRGDAPSPARDIHYAVFETIDHPVDGRTLQVTLAIGEWPGAEEPSTYTVAFDYGDCGGGRVAYDWLGGGELALADTSTTATFWSCHAVINAEGQTIYEYTSQDIVVTWVPEGLQWWVPLSKTPGLADGVRLTNTRACTGQTIRFANTDVRRRTGIDCGADTSPIGADYTVGAA